MGVLSNRNTAPLGPTALIYRYWIFGPALLANEAEERCCHRRMMIGQSWSNAICRPLIVPVFAIPREPPEPTPDATQLPRRGRFCRPPPLFITGMVFQFDFRSPPFAILPPPVGIWGPRSSTPAPTPENAPLLWGVCVFRWWCGGLLPQSVGCAPGWGAGMGELPAAFSPPRNDANGT